MRQRRSDSSQQFYRPTPEAPAASPPARRGGSIRRRVAAAIVTDPGVEGSFGRLIRAMLLLSLSLILALGAAVADVYLHRGIETSADPPYVQQVSGRGLATNVDLRSFTEAQIEAIASTLRSNGFSIVRQEFDWSEIEGAQGEFVWDHYDPIVRNLNDAGIQIVAVVEGAPVWAAQPGSIEGAIAAPANSTDFAAFLSAFVGRYGAYIDYVQVWDRPNDPGQWGGVAATPDQYVGMLAPAFNAIRTASASTQVILAEFAERDGSGALGADLRFLRGVYDVGGAPYFDAAAVAIDGGDTSPYDRRVSTSEPSLSRAELFREAMIDEGDETKPVWITHLGWNLSSSIDREKQAEYLVAAIKRIRTEWPWAGPVFQWALLPQQAGAGNEGRALLNQDGTSTVSFEAVTALSDFGVGSVAPTGFVPMDSGPVAYGGAWNDQHLDGRIFKTTSEVGANATITFEGTGIVVYLRRSPDAGLIRATLDGEPLPDWGDEDGASSIDLTYYQAQDIAVTLASNLEDGVHKLSLTMSDPGQLTIGGAVISRDPPLRWPVVVALFTALAMAVVALREIAMIAAERGGLMRRRDDSVQGPQLPSMPDWRPMPRT
ncbi:MAG TPA: hypothetical protein VFP05_09615 [Thermomicrobiales bacterium]|nr:hypothetical protein [Thermomicrobiales bacterium]